MATAPYRFIPIERNFVLKPPIKRSEIRFDKPLPEGSVSGVLDVEWTAKTSVCIGDAGDNAREVAPLKVGGRYCLPGTSLRGMLRSVVEIATFSHLGRINGDHHHGVRDTSKDKQPRIQATTQVEFKAGWLYWDSGSKKWLLRPCSHKNGHRFVLLPIEQFLGFQGKLTGISVSGWAQTSITEKYRLYSEARLQNPVSYVFPLPGAEQPKPYEILRVGLKQITGPAGKWTQGDKYPQRHLHYVFSDAYRPELGEGEGGNGKKNEALFPGPGEETFVIPQHWMDVFHGMHADYSREGGNPRGAWRVWLRAKGWTEAFKGFKSLDDDEPIPDCMMGEQLGIPVFWKGDLADLNTPNAARTPPGQQTFWFSLSRVMRVPHGYSVGNTAARLYKDTEDAVPYTVPRMGAENGWDFARSIFGEVDAANNSPQEARRDKQADTTKREDAQRGRVAVGFAFAPETVRPDPAIREGVFGQPRESFWPFYLRHRSTLTEGEFERDLTVSYSSEHAVPAGRKRTVVRRSPARTFPAGNGNEKTMTKVRFLPAGTVFKGQIRFHNLHPVELGALLYSLTLGREDGSRWHQIGRAKGMGHGAIAPRVTITSGIRYLGNAAAAVKDLYSVRQWVDHFRDWMTNEMHAANLPSHIDHPSIQMLEAMANPDIGQAIADREQLNTGDLPSFKKWREETKALDGSRSGNYPLSNPLKVR